ncbi:MAG: hypothetical protein A3E87_04600 [Gammaproteobacteria bacterium RIFCSPHIGHO2_12_FULL_35_23]|nr:MAG: hypothetical protein A3E87_04600 [Gammaproteobacteria bacterium RIFCSPHIGHO2_12_FULL_35_23]
MKLTTKGRYAVTAMLDVAIHQVTSQSGVVPLADIASRQKLSQAYLEQLFSKLRKKGLVGSSRGPQGGYSLVKEAGQITVAEIIFAIDEPIDTTRCGGAANCQKGERCMTHQLWSELNGVIFKFLASVSLKTLMENKNQVTIKQSEMRNCEQ